MIASAGISILVTAFWSSETHAVLAETNWTLVIIFAVCILLLRKFKMNPIWVMLLAGIMNAAVSLIRG